MWLNGDNRLAWQCRYLTSVSKSQDTTRFSGVEFQLSPTQPARPLFAVLIGGAWKSNLTNTFQLRVPRAANQNCEGKVAGPLLGES